MTALVLCCRKTKHPARPLNVSFITTRKTNVGDDFVREGIRAVLDSLCYYRGYLINKHEPEYTCTNALPEDEGPPLRDKILGVDVVVQCGAPVYWNLGSAPGQKCCKTEWILPLWYQRISQVYQSKPILNIAAGACQSYFGSAREIVADEDCVRFTKDIHGFCRFTTVRDKIAEELNRLLELAVVRLPCASIHAWRRFRDCCTVQNDIALNFMALGGHYDLDGRLDRESWARTFVEIDRRLRSRGRRISLVAHDTAELESLQTLFPGRKVFYSPRYSDYFPFYARCAGGIFSRVHGAMLLAGRGAAAVLVGNDSRSWMIDELSLPRCHVSEACPASIVDALLAMLENAQLRQRLLETEATAFQTLQALCATALRDLWPGATPQIQGGSRNPPTRAGCTLEEA